MLPFEYRARQLEERRGCIKALFLDVLKEIFTGDMTRKDSLRDEKTMCSGPVSARRYPNRE